jgi:hypothetical protein
MRKAILICVFFMMIFGLSSLSVAQDMSAKELAAQNEAQLEMMAEQTAAQKAYLAETIVGQREGGASGRSFDPQYRAALVKDLASLPIESLQTLQSNGGYYSSENAVVQNLGDSSADLVYTPVTPCRIIDTRNAGGIIAANTTRDFYVAVTNYSVQGGSATTCGIPFGPATAVMINYVAVSPTSSGDLRAWPYGGTMPTASVINYIPNQNVANAVIQPICDPAVSGCLSYDLSVHADSRNVHLVADVVGYFRKFPKEQVKSFTVTNRTGNTTTIGTSCTNYMSVTVNAPGAGKVLVRGNLQFIVDHAIGATDWLSAFIGTSPTDCSSSNGYAGYTTIPSVLPSSLNYPWLYPFQSFTISAAQSVTYYLNGYYSSSPNVPSFWYGGMEATFIPD